METTEQSTEDPFTSALAALEGSSDEPQAPAAETAAPVAAEAPPDTETPTNGEAAPAPEEPKISKTQYYAQLAEQQRENRLLKKKLKEVEQAPASTNYEQLAKEDPLAVMDKLGIDMDTVLQRLAAVPADGYPAQDAKASDPTAKEIKELKQQLQQMQQQQQQRTQAGVIQQEVRRIGSLLDVSEKAAPGKYEYIAATKDEGSLNLVLDTARQIYERDGEVPAYTEVFDLVEQHLREQELRRFERLKGLSFIKSHLTGAAPAVQSDAGNGAQPQPTKTLAPQEDTPRPKEMTEEERFHWALEAMGDKK